MKIVGYILFLGLMIGAMVIDTPIAVFIDVPSTMIVLGSSFCVMLIGGREHVLNLGSNMYLWSLCAAALVFSGFIGGVIGIVKMLYYSSDPALIGPSMAVTLLTSLYACFLIAVVAAPKIDQHVMSTNSYEDWDISRTITLVYPLFAIMMVFIAFFVLLYALSDLS